MASSFSKISGDDAAQYLLLRSIRYRQSTPYRALKTFGPSRLSEVLSIMMADGLIMQRASRYILTESGESRLLQLAGGHKIPLIDHAPVLKSKSLVGRFQIEASTAREIVKRVSGGSNSSEQLPGR